MKKFFYILITLILVCCLTLLPCSAVGSSLHLVGNEWDITTGTYAGVNENGNPKYNPKKVNSDYILLLSYDLPTLDVSGDYTISFKYWHTCNASSKTDDSLCIAFLDSTGRTVSNTYLFDVTDRTTTININTTVSFKYPAGASSAKLILISSALVSMPVYCYDITITGNNISQQVAEGFAETQQKVDKLSEDINKGFDDLNNAGSNEPPLDTDISAFQSAIDTMNGWLDQLDQFADTIDTAGQTAHEYISQGSNLITGFLGVAPTAVIALVAFGVVFVVVRKIVGR